MGSLIEALRRLQDVELQLARLRGEEEAKARRIKSHTRQLRKIEDRIHEAEVNIHERQRQIDLATLDASTKEQAVAKHREALSKAKTNKEYAAILLALNTEKADSAKIESRVLELMERNQALTKSKEQLQEERTQILDRMGSIKRELEAYRGETRAERDRLEAKREACADSIPPSALSKFNRVAEHHDGEGMVPVARIHPKREEYACSGCNMTVTLEVVSSLKTGEELQSCKVCGRLLYIEDEPAKSR
jgi:predicted  nucleic acid-binding Zn-ribbon protein